MKKILLFLLLSPLAYTDTNTASDRVCSIELTESGLIISLRSKILAKGCERNNVLEISTSNVPGYKTKLIFLSNRYCRFDRNRFIEPGTLSCILYGKEPRASQN